MNENKTHFRKAFKSPYLSSADIVDPVTLTVKYVGLEKDETKKTKDMFNTAHFVETEIRDGEKLKPMILNAGNSKIMTILAGSPYIDDWCNIPIIVYVDKNVRFGRNTVEGLRIDTKRPRIEKPVLEKGTKAWDKAVQAYGRGDFAEVKKHMQVTPEAEKEIKELANALD